MTREFVQVKPDNGYLIHAVPADAEAYQTSIGTERWSKKGVLCRKIQGRDAQRFPSLTFLRDKNGNKLPFTATMWNEAEVPVCKVCASRVRWASTH